MSWRRLLGLGGREAPDPGGPAASPRRAGVRVVPLRTLGSEPQVVARASSRSELGLLAPLAPFRPAGACVLVAGTLSSGACPEVGAGHLLAGSGGPSFSSGPSGAIVLCESERRADGAPFERFAPEAGGEGFPGVTGLRVLFRRGGLAALRLGPPPGARWAITGLHALVVFDGRLTVVDAGEPVDAVAWEAVLVNDPSAAVHVVAGNDSLRAVAFAAADVAVGLG